GGSVSSNTTNLTVTVAGVAALSVIAGAIWFGLGASPSAPIRSEDSVTATPSGTLVRVHVSGAVSAPGVVELASDAIVADAVRAAGGATRSADLTAINLAAGVRAGERIVVPEFQPAGAPSGATAESGIDLNTASASALESLPGVGPVLAERIVAFRTERGPFATVEDLLDVPGIGESKLASMRDAIARP
ncbi:MAG: helix-hairpin-helix domain-containing protein, partial [Acidimicrobiia bacterium]